LSYEDHRANRRAVDKDHAEETNRLLAQMLAAAPDEAVPLYLAAELAAERGEFKEALAHLDRGNRAAQCSPALVGFPGVELNPLLAEAPRGSQLVQGWAYGQSRASRGLLNATVMTALAEDCVQRQDYAGLKTLTRCACRTAGQPYLAAKRHPYWVKFLRDIYHAVLTAPHVAASPARQQALKVWSSKLQAIDREVAAIDAQVVALPAQVETPRGKMLGRLTGGQTNALLSYELGFRQATLQRQLVKAKLVPLWQDLAKFDWRQFAPD
jgi:hypothetical protein